MYKHNSSYFESPNMYSVLIIEMSVFINMNLDAYISINHCKLYTKIWACLLLTLSENTGFIIGFMLLNQVFFAVFCLLFSFLFFCYEMSFNCYFFNVYALISSNFSRSFIHFIQFIDLFQMFYNVTTTGVRINPGDYMVNYYVICVLYNLFICSQFICSRYIIRFLFGSPWNFLSWWWTVQTLLFIWFADKKVGWDRVDLLIVISIVHQLTIYNLKI